MEIDRYLKFLYWGCWPILWGQRHQGGQGVQGRLWQQEGCLDWWGYPCQVHNFCWKTIWNDVYTENGCLQPQWPGCWRRLLRMTLLILTSQRLWTGKTLPTINKDTMISCKGISSPPTTLMGMLTPESATGCGERQGQTMEEFLDARWAF